MSKANGSLLFGFLEFRSPQKRREIKEEEREHERRSSQDNRKEREQRKPEVN